MRLASSWIQPVTSVSAGPPLGGLYLKPPSSGGLCDGVTTMPSARPRRAAAVVGQDRVREGRRRDEAVAAVHQDVDAVRDEDLERRARGRLREGVRVAAQEERPVDPQHPPVAGDGRAGGDDVGLVERALQRRAAVPGRPEGDPLGRDRRVGGVVEVGGEEAVDVDEDRRVGRQSGALADGHRCASPPAQPGVDGAP